ncbi:hypothetical protein NEM99_24370, partial [Escherichia coli]|nr:hypothetical protein [Escherichia coli]
VMTIAMQSLWAYRRSGRAAPFALTRFSPGGSAPPEVDRSPGTRAIRAMFIQLLLDGVCFRLVLDILQALFFK